MREENALNFKRSNTVSGAFYHIIVSADEPNVSALVLPSKVTGVITSIFIAVVNNVLSVIISAKEACGMFGFRVSYNKFANLTDSAFRTIIITNGEIVYRGGLAC